MTISITAIFSVSSLFYFAFPISLTNRGCCCRRRCYRHHFSDSSPATSLGDSSAPHCRPVPFSSIPSTACTETRSLWKEIRVYLAKMASEGFLLVSTIKRNLQTIRPLNGTQAEPAQRIGHQTSETIEQNPCKN